MAEWMHSASYVFAAFLGSSVEAIEALTIVLAVGTVRGWRPALAGAAGGGLALALIVLLFGRAIASIPIGILQVVIGALLLLFGIRWLRKAILRSAGVIALHDEDGAFSRQTQALSSGIRRGWDVVAIATAFKAVVLEGIEVVVIVIGVGAVGHMLVPASIGALGACLLVIVAGVLLRRPLARVPENALKLAVGILISAFGLFWFGEGIGVAWPYHDLAILGLAGALLLLSRISVSLARHAARA